MLPSPRLLVLLVIHSTDGLYWENRIPLRRAVAGLSHPIVAMKQSELPDKLRELGCDEEFWDKVVDTNKKKRSLVRLMRKADDESIKARISTLKRLAEEEARAIEEEYQSRICCLRLEGELAVVRRAKAQEALNAILQHRGQPSPDRRMSTPPAPAEPPVAGLDDRIAWVRQRAEEREVVLLAVKVELLKREGEEAIQRREVRQDAYDSFLAKRDVNDRSSERRAAAVRVLRRLEGKKEHRRVKKAKEEKRRDPLETLTAEEKQAQLHELLAIGLVTQEEIDAAIRADGDDEAQTAMGAASAIAGQPDLVSPRMAAPIGSLEIRSDPETRLPSTLSPALAEAFRGLDLMDPTTMTPEQQSNTVAAVATGTLVVFPLLFLKFGFLGDLAFSTFVGGGTAGYAALRNDVVGVFTRDVVGGTANIAALNVLRGTEELIEEYEIARRSQDRLQRQLEQLLALRGRIDKEN